MSNRPRRYSYLVLIALALLYSAVFAWVRRPFDGES